MTLFLVTFCFIAAIAAIITRSVIQIRKKYYDDYMKRKRL